MANNAPCCKTCFPSFQFLDKDMNMKVVFLVMAIFITEKYKGNRNDISGSVGSN